MSSWRGGQRRLTRRGFLRRSLPVLALLPFGSYVPALLRLEGVVAGEGGPVSEPAGATEADRQFEAELWRALHRSPHQIRHYDALIRLYGRQKRYAEIHALLSAARRTLQAIAARAPARHGRYRTAMRLIDERLARVGARAASRESERGKLAQW